MKTSLNFSLPEEQDDFNTAINGKHYKEAVRRVSVCMRNLINYTILSDAERTVVKKIYEELQASLQRSGIPE